MNISPAAILVIENHPMMRAALCAAIADESDLTIVAVAANRANILQLVSSLKPDIILLSIGNPGHEDLSALAALHKKSPSLPILGLTSNEVAGQEQAALEAGARAVLTKSAPRAELIRGLRKLLANQSADSNVKQGANGKMFQQNRPF